MRVAIEVRSVREQREGIGNYALSLVQGLAEVLPVRQGLPMEILLLGDHRTAWPLLPPFARCVGPEGPLWHAWAAQVASREADVYHSTGSFFAPLLTRKPVVLTVHDLVSLRYPGTASRWTQITQKALGLGLRRARIVKAVSRFTAEEIAREFPHAAGKIVAVPHAARSLGTPSPLAADRLPPRYILAVGSLSPRKNLMTLMRAHALLSAPPPLVLVGHRRWNDGELRQALARHPHPAHVLPAVSDAELGAIYAACGVFVFPSRYEGFGLPVVEAMACGAPVVASKASAIPEAAGDAALLVDPDDPAQIAEAISRVLGEPDLRSQLVARGRARAAQRTWADAARETAELYDRASEARGAPGDC